MRLLLVSPGLPPDKTGGIENYVQMIRRGLEKRGHSVTVLTQLHRLRLHDPNVVQIGLKSGEFRGYAYWAAKAWPKSLAARCDIVHFNGFPGQILSLAPALSPKVVHVHNSLSMEQEWWKNGGIRHNAGYQIASQAFERASLVVSPTNVEKREIIKNSNTDPSKIRVIPNCIDTQFYRRENVMTDVRETYGLQDKFVVLYFGKIKKTKGIESLCRAFRYLKRNVDAALIVGGSIPATDDFVTHLREAYPEVIFTGFVKDPRPYYAAADVFSILTSGFHGGEVFPIALLEAMSMGLPTVCAENPIFREITMGNGLFADPESPQSVARNLEDLARNRDMCMRIGRRNREITLQYYNVAEVVNQLEDAYASQVR